MKLCIISPGKKHDTLVSPFITEFEKRLTPYFTLEWIFPEASDKKEEAKKILGVIREDDSIFLLDEKGKSFTSLELANFLEIEKNKSTKRLVFIIGGAFGVDEEVKERAHKILSLSELVFPHMLVRAILIEQLYRASTITFGGKYHHE